MDARLQALVDELKDNLFTETFWDEVNGCVWTFEQQTGAVQVAWQHVSGATGAYVLETAQLIKMTAAEIEQRLLDALAYSVAEYTRIVEQEDW